jgi:DNA modification methylase
MVPIGELIPYAANARTHDDGQVAKIASSIKEFGFNNPVLIDPDKGIIAGHGRVMAAKKLGMTEVPTYTLDHLTDAQRRAYILADNRLALDAGWDKAMLAAEVERLMGEGMDIKLAGFSQTEIDNLMQKIGKGLTDENDTPEVPIEPVSRLGDVWILGNHRIMCGDSTSADNVASLLNGAKPHLMVTDPPYGVEYDAAAARDGSSAVGKVLNDDRADWREAWALFPGNIAYVWHADRHCGEVFDSLQACDFKVRAQIIWAKSSLVFSRGDYHSQHEPCLYAVKGTGKWTGDRKQTTIWNIDKPQKSETGHSTQKPVECMRRPILNNSNSGDSVYDPFLGSGTTVMAAESVDRKCYGMELNPAYVDMAIMRWQSFTGKSAILESTGEPFKAAAKLEKTA